MFCWESLGSGVIVEVTLTQTTHLNICCRSVVQLELLKEQEELKWPTSPPDFNLMKETCDRLNYIIIITLQITGTTKGRPVLWLHMVFLKCDERYIYWTMTKKAVSDGSDSSARLDICSWLNWEKGLHLQKCVYFGKGFQWPFQY